MLAEKGLAVRELKQLPPQAKPAPSVTPRGMRRAAVFAAIGFILACGGGLSRFAIYDSPRVGLGGDRQTGGQVPEGVVVRELSSPDGSGLKQARLSPDGRRVWAVTQKGQQGPGEQTHTS